MLFKYLNVDPATELKIRMKKAKPHKSGAKLFWP